MSARLAAFVTPHGFGHAARAAAVLAEAQTRRPSLGLDLYTTVPRWFFEDSLAGPFRYHRLACDVGLVQSDPLDENPAATADALERFLPFSDGLLDGLARRLRRQGCGAVLADISPLGLAAARRAGLPSALVENFTWDWAYRPYFRDEPRLRHASRLLRPLFEGATLRVQTAPVCSPRPRALAVPPVSRRPRAERAEVRRHLGIEDEQRLVLFTMGGLGRGTPAAVRRWAARAGGLWVVPGAARRPRRTGNLLLLPWRSPVFHPDLVAAADAVVGKLGYSTVCEAVRAGTPLAFVPRRRFPESDVLRPFVRERLPSFEIALDALEEGAWADRLGDLFGRRGEPLAEDGAAAAASALLGLLDGGDSGGRRSRRSTRGK